MKTRTAETSQQKNFQFKSIKMPHFIKIEIINFPQIIYLTLQPKKKNKKKSRIMFQSFFQKLDSGRVILFLNKALSKPLCSFRRLIAKVQKYLIWKFCIRFHCQNFLINWNITNLLIGRILHDTVKNLITVHHLWQILLRLKIKFWFRHKRGHE